MGKKVFDGRFFRDTCTEEFTFLVKDLRVFTDHYDLSDIVIVDNQASCYAYQLENGIPIVPFTNFKQDDELRYVALYLDILAEKPDVRLTNKEAFGLKLLLRKKEIGVSAVPEALKAYQVEGIAKNVRNNSK